MDWLTTWLQNNKSMPSIDDIYSRQDNDYIIFNTRQFSGLSFYGQNSQNSFVLANDTCQRIVGKRPTVSMPDDAIILDAINGGD